MNTITKEKYEAVIGLEVHCQLKTKTKLFSTDSYNYGEISNSQVGPITLALPGTLPVLNNTVLEMAIKAGLALNCKIAECTKFDRKHYFYPDLPKAYQISQYDEPYAIGGNLQFRRKDGTTCNVNLTRIHIEEDAGKLIHANSGGVARTYVDLNRAGVPLLEIVTEPDLRNANDASDFLQNLRAILRTIQITDGNMEEGSLRCDANVSVRKSSNDKYGTRVEVKNLNSFKAVRSAIDYEIQRQIDLIESGGVVIQSTVLWDSDNRRTMLMRTKEDAEDYRYFPDPDLLPIHISTNLVNKIKSELPELPEEKHKRYVEKLKLSIYDADVLIKETEITDYFENVYEICKDAKKASNWVKDEVLGILNKEHISITEFKCTAKRLAQMIIMLNENKITSPIAKQVFEKIYKEDLDPDVIVEKYKLKPMDLGNLDEIINKVFLNNKENVQKILEGNERVKGHLVGEVMKVTRGQAPPQEVNTLINKKLSELKEVK